ncbi:MAG TPA: hypothetical protein VGH74_04880, partial [Planctomycetaceae bacterium]
MNKQSIICMTLLAFWLGCAQHALAQTNLVTIDKASSSPPLRSDAPMTFVWRIQSQSSKLIEGRLEVTVHDGPELLGHAEVEDIVLNAGEQFVRTILPPVESNNPNNTFAVNVRFISKNVKLGSYDIELTAPSQWQRNLVMLVCTPGQTALPADVRQLADRLRVESWNADNNDRTISTISSYVRPDDLPIDPLGYCGYDLVVLAYEALAELKESQMKPLLEWVDAGGSLCLVPGQTSLKDFHANFLNRAAHSSESDPQFVVDPSGRLMTPGSKGDGAEIARGENSQVLLRRHGLGRIAIIHGKLDKLLAAPGKEPEKELEKELRSMLSFLWKMRHDRLADFLNSGTFLVKSDKPVDEVKPGDTGWQSRNFNVSYAQLRPQDKQLAQLPLQSGDQLLTRLMPEGLRVVPMSLIGVILIVYVLLIGPGDWFVLGAIKRRKWTWFTFPFVTVALTLLTVWLAEWYMQISDNRRAVTFHDVGADGRISRRNRFEVLFQGSERDVQTELAREIFSAMTLQRFSSAMWYNYQQQQIRGVDQRRAYTQVPRVAGRVPAHYTVTQFLSQWTPQLNRRFSIPRAPTQSVSDSQEPTATGADKPQAFDWGQFADAKTYNPETLAAAAGPNGQAPAGNLQLRNDLAARVKQAFGESAHIALFIKGKREVLSGNFAFLHSGPVYGVDAQGNPINQQQIYYPG